MSEPIKLEYVTYILTNPETVWQALTDGQVMRIWWPGREIEAAWIEGSNMTMRSGPEHRIEFTGTILECERLHRLAYTVKAEWDEVLGRERPNRIRWVLKDFAPIVRLTLVNDDFEPESKVPEMVAAGWPAILSNLKTYLETGRPLPLEAVFGKIE
jgi:uncharacterized protein YndB with AHSA1/START domain